MKPTYSYYLIECLLSEGLQIGSRGMHGNDMDNFHPNDVCVEYEGTLFTLGLKHVGYLVDAGLVARKYFLGELWQLAGLLVPPRPLDVFYQAILLPVERAVVKYLMSLDGLE